MTKKKHYGKSEETGRRTVDYFGLIDQLEAARKDMGFQSFSEFARQIARDWLITKDKLV